MKTKALETLFVIGLLLSTFTVVSRIPRVYAVAYTIPVAFPSIAAALASGLLVPGDELYLNPGYVEVLAAPLVIAIPLSIIGSPPGAGPMPIINVNGFNIVISAPMVLIWGLNIIDPTAISAPLLWLTPLSTNAWVMNNIIQGSWLPNIGILVQGTNNIVTLNTISQCGICIDVAGPISTGNVIKLNTINLPNNIGIQVDTLAGPNNEIYWNNVWAPSEFWDLSPGSPPNFFDDISLPGSPDFPMGNYWGSTLPPPLIPFPIPGPGANGWFDGFPQPAAVVRIAGDLDVNGRVDIFDILRMTIIFGRLWAQNGWDPRADVNGDGTINILDVVLVAINYGALY